MRLVGGSNEFGPWPVYHNGGLLEHALWVAIFGWLFHPIGVYFTTRMQPPYPGLTDPTIAIHHPVGWMVWGVLVVFAIVLTLSPANPSPNGAKSVGDSDE